MEESESAGKRAVGGKYKDYGPLVPFYSVVNNEQTKGAVRPLCPDLVIALPKTSLHSNGVYATQLGIKA
jgi:hypothetical protein